MKKIICDYCGKESDNTTEYTFPDYVVYEAKDYNDNVLCKFWTNDIQDSTKDVCPDCRNKIASLLHTSGFKCKFRWR